MHEVTKMTPDDAEDPLVAKYVEAALAPYIGRMPPEDLEVFRARLVVFYETNPEAVALLDEIRQAQTAAPVVERSGEKVRRGAAELEQAARRGARTKGGPSVTSRRDGLTVEQSNSVRDALPELHRLARSLARRCPNQTLGELQALAEDSLISRVRRWDPAKGRLMDFARKSVRRDVLRAAYTRANDPCLGGALHAMDIHEDGIEAPDTATRWAESIEEEGGPCPCARARSSRGRVLRLLRRARAADAGG
ncbi:Hypothetical protein A7982_00480 [Minicystis rosea]|nr:Hypothetical protein A7982_00480 [Minicystis rosea]